VSVAAESSPSSHPARIASRVSSLELLLDLVFVFTISQITEVIVAQPTWTAVAQAVLTMTVVFWMYDAFAWLTNQSTPDTLAVRLLIIAAMAGFLVMSLAIPDAFGASGILFGATYLVVVWVHAGLFVAQGGSGARAMLRVGPINTVVALLLMASGFVEGALDWVLFLVPLVLFAISGVIASRVGFMIGASHFVERHGLLMIVAFGESIVSVGAGLTEHRLDAGLVLGAVATVAVVASLWWCYFATGDGSASRVVDAASPFRRTVIALSAFFGCHLVMILGLVGLGAGLHLALADSLAPAGQAPGWLLAAGVAVYLLGDAEYRRELSLGPWGWRVVAAGVCLALGFIGSTVPALALICALALVVAAAPAVEATRRWASRQRDGGDVS
jgi:low temperature requirement protein LtrA